MKKSILILSLVLLPSASLANDDYYYIQQKRAIAEQQKMMMMQQIQHRKQNPMAYINQMNRQSEQASVSFEASGNGHFYVPAALNGRDVNFIADTGASTIFLTQDDARKIGLNVSNLNYNKVYNTANGQVRAAETTIDNFKVGPIELSGMPVTVSPNTGGQSLLGMSFFQKLSSYNVKDGVLTLNR